MSPIEVPAKIQLVEKRETRTSRGMLSKGWYLCCHFATHMLSHGSIALCQSAIIRQVMAD